MKIGNQLLAMECWGLNIKKDRLVIKLCLCRLLN